MDKGGRRRLRRNRWIGVALFAALAAAGWVYSDYCLSHEIPSDITNRCGESAKPHTRRLKVAETVKESLSATGKAKDAADIRSSEKGSLESGSGSPGCTLSLGEGLELPLITSEDFVIRNEEGRYTVLYDTLCRQPVWVAYVLTGNDISGGVKRKDRFVPDPHLVQRKWPAAAPSNYRGTGYDRGHLCPSADRTASQTENDCTFYMSNIAPQTPALNRGPWKRLEEQVRKWAVKYDSVYVVTAGVLTEGLKTIPGSVAVPELFYKAVLTRHGGEFHAIGFILPNADRFRGDYSDYAVTIDSLETLTSLDFFYNLPDEAEREAERAWSAEFWFE